MPTRRNLLKGGAAAAIAAGASVTYLARGTSAFAADRLPITVVNNTGLYGNSAIWMYIVGTNLTTGQQSYVKADGSFVPVSASLNGSDGYADLSIPLASSGNSLINLPHMSGRVYFSINTKLKFKVVTDAGGRSALQYPAGWVPSDPNYNVLHDCMEFTLNDAGMFCNTTMVDMLSIPMSINLAGAKHQSIGALVDGGRDKIFAAISALPDFSKLVIGNLRVIAPGHGLGTGRFSPTYYDAYINEVWGRYSSTDMTIKTDATTFRGRVRGGNFAFDGNTSPIRKPTTKDVFFCDGALAAPNDGRTGPLAAMLGAGFNRSLLLEQPHQPITDPGRYYKQPTSNHYSRVMHENSVDGKAYGFAFDDILDYASYIQDSAPSAMTLTLTPFKGGGQSQPGAGLLSRGRPATASSQENGGLSAANAVDGNPGTRWASQFSDQQWITVDLESTRSVNRVRLNWEAAYGKAYRIEGSTNGSTWSTLHTNNNSDGGVDDISFPTASARYVRVQGLRRATQYGYSLWDFEVYGM